MATVIVKVEKKYPNFIFTTASGREYKAEYHPRTDNSYAHFIYYNTLGKVSDNLPAPLSPYRELLELFCARWYSNDKESVRWYNTIDGITSLPTFSFSNFPARDFNSFMNKWHFPPKKIIKWYSNYNNQMFDENFFISQIVSREQKWTDEEIINTPRNYLRVRYMEDKKFRQLWIKAKQNAATYFMTEDCIGNTIDRYLTDCKFLGQKPDTGELWKNAKIVCETARQAREQQEEEMFAKTQQLYPLFFEDENFLTVIPTTYRECADEGEAMHNCVGGIEWNYHLKNGDRVIVFIRRKTAPDVPYVDCDITTCDLVPRQIFMKCNKECHDADFLDFRNKYTTYLRTIKRENEGA